MEIESYDETETGMDNIISSQAEWEHLCEKNFYMYIAPHMSTCKTPRLVLTFWPGGPDGPGDPGGPVGPCGGDHVTRDTTRITHPRA